MNDYPPRVEKSENIYKLWEQGDGDMAELAIGLFDLTAHYKALWDDYAQLEAENDELKTVIAKHLIGGLDLKKYVYNKGTGEWENG